jgi:hypothetical protein
MSSPIATTEVFMILSSLNSSYTIFMIGINVRVMSIAMIRR